MKEAILILDVIAALGIVGLVLLQQGKGADMGSGFGSGASQTLFGARGSSNFLTRATAILAIIFFTSNMTLAWLASKEVRTPTSATVIDTPVMTEEVPTPTAPPASSGSTQQKVPEVPK